MKSIDNTNYRYGRSTLSLASVGVHKRWNMATAILTGDAILSLAIKHLHDYYSTNNNITKIFSDALLAICEGQALDIEFETRKDISIDDYLNMIELKTGYLFGLSSAIGSMCSKKNVYIYSKFKEFLNI